MKTMSAREAKNALGLMIGTACAGPVLIGKHERDIAAAVAVEEYERLTGKPMADRRTTQNGRNS